MWWPGPPDAVRFCYTAAGLPDPASAPAALDSQWGFGLERLGSHPCRIGRKVEFVLEVPRASIGSVRVFNVVGQAVATLFAGRVGAGRRTLAWNANANGGQRVSAGVYFVRAEMQGVGVRSQRILLLPPR